MLKDVLAVPHDKRDERWAQKFFETIINTRVKLVTPEPQEGPDGFPYLLVTDQGEDENFSSIIKWGAEKGVGIAFNAQKEMPDFVFTYGMLWNYLTRGQFYTPLENISTAPIEVQGQQTFFVGKPADTYWPPPARKIFKEFLQQQGLIAPKMIMLGEKQDGPMDIAFSIESLGNPPQQEWNGILEAFSWFFPAHYSLVLVSEKSLADAQFIDV